MVGIHDAQTLGDLGLCLASLHRDARNPVNIAEVATKRRGDLSKSSISGCSIFLGLRRLVPKNLCWGFDMDIHKFDLIVAT